MRIGSPASTIQAGHGYVFELGRDNADHRATLLLVPGLCQNFNYFLLKSPSIWSLYSKSFYLKALSFRDFGHSVPRASYGIAEIMDDFLYSLQEATRQPGEYNLLTFSFGGTLLLWSLSDDRFSHIHQKISRYCIVSPLLMQESGSISLGYEHYFGIMMAMGGFRFVPMKFISWLMNAIKGDFEYYKSVNNSSIRIHKEVFDRIKAGNNFGDIDLMGDDTLFVSCEKDTVCPPSEITLFLKGRRASCPLRIFDEPGLSHKNIMFSQGVSKEITAWLINGMGTTN